MSGRLILPDHVKDFQRQATEDLTKDTLTIPLRFRRSSARVLDALVLRLKSEGVGTENITLFEQAAEAARNGEPLQVRCDHVDEAKALAAAFGAYGIAEPTIG